MPSRPRSATLRPMQTEPIHPAVRVGHVHLRVADLDRSLAFYRDALGLGVTADGRERGLDAAFLAAGDYHHHIGLNTWESACSTTASRSTTAPTTAAPCPSTCPTRTATASSSTTTAHGRTGSTPMAGPCSRPTGSTTANSSPP